MVSRSSSGSITNHLHRTLVGIEIILDLSLGFTLFTWECLETYQKYLFINFFPAEPWIQRCKSPVGNPQLIQFSREIIDLLKSRPSCLIPISKFIPSYHHHFAKQCRVSDYGFSKLLELLEAVPHVLQVLEREGKQTQFPYTAIVLMLYFILFSNR